MSNLLETLSKEAREKVHEVDFPDWLEPMLATLTDDRFSDERWIYERKLDGERCLAYLNSGETKLRSRNRKELNNAYPEVAAALSRQERESLMLDGEIVAFEGELTSFSKLQKRMKINDPDEARESGVSVYYYVFDVCYIDGYDVRDVPLRQRKELLRQALDFEDPIRFTEHRNRDGEKYFKSACSKGWEGLIAKDATAPYVAGRSKKWLKFKCVREQEFVIGGFTDPKGSRVGLGALLVGYYEEEELRYAGKIGTGYDNETLRDLRHKLDRLEIEKPAFSSDGLPNRDVHWVEPKLVAQAKFTEWTEDGKLRHPVYLGLRADKAPKEVEKEEAQ